MSSSIALPAAYNLPLMKKVFILLLLAIPCYVIGQHKSTPHKAAKKAIVYEDEYPSPFKGKPFKPGVPRVLVLEIPIGKITAKFKITYELVDIDGDVFSFGSLYRADVEDIVPLGPQTDTAFSNMFAKRAKERTIQLTEAEVKAKYIRTSSISYWFDVDDFNMDGVPDFSYVIDYGFHGDPLGHSVFVNLKRKLYRWRGYTNEGGETEDAKKRILRLLTERQGKPSSNYYKVTGDTTLVPLPGYDTDADTKK